MKRLSFSHAVGYVVFFLIALGLAGLAANAPFSWASPLTSPDRQTVPPPTATPKPEPPAPPAPPPPPLTLFEIAPAVVYAGPGEKTEVIVTVYNTTSSTMSNVEAVIAAVPDLALEAVRADRGEVVTGSIRWLLGILEPGHAAHLTLRATMPTNVTPETCLVLEGTLTWAGGGPTLARASLCAPASILPKTGEE